MEKSIQVHLNSSSTQETSLQVKVVEMPTPEENYHEEERQFIPITVFDF